ncbi:LamB/YcsF family protein [Thioalkalivibrio sp. HK1]|uniref:LamB/YcsF family protein n=1 Tax=Thioalkalivibrio sp. HK1 TaxID=1469245 RepID=UPI00046FEC2F|nr:5-oxoprolinase subunit PxpA [Thioalkalivibrio sp. HK1]
MSQVDLNSDLGESFGPYTIGNDPEMLKIISSANVACGFHGGDPLVMHRTLELARENGVGVGAHPGFNDLWGFGRRQIRVQDVGEIEKMLIYQVGAIQGMARACGVPLVHYKLHGALGNMACVDADLAMAAARAIEAVAPELIFVVLPGSELERAGESLGLKIAKEIFADRAYDDDGMLVPRGQPGAMIEDANEAASRVARFVEDGAIQSQSGKRIEVDIDTICVHGDNPSAVAMAAEVRKALTSAGIEIAPMAQRLN